MPPRSHRILCLALAVVLGLGPTSALALLNIGGSRNQVFVFGNVRVGYDSNIFSSATAEDDTVITGSFGAELRRKRGIIGVNSTVTPSAARRSAANAASSASFCCANC